MSDALTNLVTAAGTLGGAGSGAYVTLRVHRLERAERVKERLFEARRAAYGPAAIRDAMSLLRTELKIELGVREEAERDAPTPR